MTWFRRHTGLDFFDVLIHAGVTLAAMAFFGMQNEEEMLPLVLGTSFVILGIRRHLALRKAGADPEGLTSGQMAALRLEEIEQRLVELESATGRVGELEERVEFAERLLAQTSGERRLLVDPGGAGASPGQPHHPR